ncbi:hypothetical protein DENIS_1200 [Desulfonema ishimotonii]|uniref:Uncharacterized protein n=2 Tax=Desulfonema ishimotonii TaxID=45657 RepID=A0A401FTF8_9BACT|nr:hypothetical protein DENIS_1200 [Desulfonema ishimotonii]
MSIKDDFSSSMTDEVLTDMAGKFFGDRKELENKIGIFREYAEALSEKAAQVNARAAFLNYLLMNRDNAVLFYESLGITPSVFLIAGIISGELLPPFVPSAFTVRGEFVRLAEWAYDRLQRTCDDYMNGNEESDGEDDDKHGDVNYRLLSTMCDLINQDVDKVNEDVMPSQVLYCFKRFNTESDIKECVTGGGTFLGDDCSLNRELAFEKIDFDSFKLKKYPEIPPLSRVKSKIETVCKKLYAQNKEEIRSMMADLKERCKTRLA